MAVKNSETHLSGNKILSERELEVLKLSAEGNSNKEIAALLYITIDTIDTHSRNIVNKMSAKNMKHAIALGIRNKLIN